VPRRDIIKHVRGLLARFKALKTVTFGELPKASTGKIQKFVLRGKAWAGAEHRIQ
jgi:fatty-acyl-CoA synthase